MMEGKFRFKKPLAELKPEDAPEVDTRSDEEVTALESGLHSAITLDVEDSTGAHFMGVDRYMKALRGETSSNELARDRSRIEKRGEELMKAMRERLLRGQDGNRAAELRLRALEKILPLIGIETGIGPKVTVAEYEEMARMALLPDMPGMGSEQVRAQALAKAFVKRVEQALDVSLSGAELMVDLAEHDMTVYAMATARLEDRATRDDKTDFINSKRAIAQLFRVERRRFRKQFAKEEFKDPADERTMLWVKIDLDHLKQWNDQLTENGVDSKIIQPLAKKLKQTFRVTDLFCRAGRGDEFDLVFNGVRRKDVDLLLKKVLDTVHEVTVDGVPIGASIGGYIMDVATVNELDVRDARLFFEETSGVADVAVKAAKEAGRDRVQVYSPELREQIKLDDDKSRELDNVRRANSRTYAKLTHEKGKAAADLWMNMLLAHTAVALSSEPEEPSGDTEVIFDDFDDTTGN